jgi:hypothetical protein
MFPRLSYPLRQYCQLARAKESWEVASPWGRIGLARLGDPSGRSLPRARGRGDHDRRIEVQEARTIGTVRCTGPFHQRVLLRMLDDVMPYLHDLRRMHCFGRHLWFASRCSKCQSNHNLRYIFGALLLSYYYWPRTVLGLTTLCWSKVG